MRHTTTATVDNRMGRKCEHGRLTARRCRKNITTRVMVYDDDTGKPMHGADLCDEHARLTELCVAGRNGREVAEHSHCPCGATASVVDLGTGRVACDECDAAREDACPDCGKTGGVHTIECPTIDSAMWRAWHRKADRVEGYVTNENGGAA